MNRHRHLSPDPAVTRRTCLSPARRLPASGQSLRRLATLPRETIVSIFGHVASPAHPAPRYLAPFLVCGSEWFDMAYPFVWMRVCLQAIAFSQINADRRAAYAGSIQTFLAAETCGCRRCTWPPTAGSPNTVHPVGTIPGVPIPLTHADTLVFRTLEAFPKLRVLDLGCDCVSLLVDIGQHLGATADSLTRLHVGSLGSGCQAPSRIIDLMSSLDNLEHLEVRQGGFSQVEPEPVCRRPYCPKLQSAHLFPHRSFTAPTDGCEFPGDVLDEHFPPWDMCSALLGALSGGPNLRQLRAFVPRMVGSLVRPIPAWDPPYRPRRRPFAALEELTVAIQSPRALQHVPELKKLTKLAISFDASEVGSSIMDIFPLMPHLQQLKLLANQGDHPAYSWCSTFTVADIAIAIKPMKKLQSLTFSFPARCLHHDHTEAAHNLLLSVATDNPNLKKLCLGFNIPFPLPAWENASEMSQSSLSLLQVLTIKSYRPYNRQGETNDIPAWDPQKNTHKLRQIFPLLREFVVIDRPGLRVRLPPATLQ